MITERGVERLDAGRYSTRDHPRCAIALGQGVGALFRLGKCPAPTKKAGVPPDLKRTRRVHAQVAVGGRIHPNVARVGFRAGIDFGGSALIFDACGLPGPCTAKNEDCSSLDRRI